MLIRLLCVVAVLFLVAGCDTEREDASADRYEDQSADLVALPPDPIRPDQVQYFKHALVEYRRQDSLEVRAHGVKNQERAHLRTWIAFKELKYSYRELNNRECDSVFADSIAHVEGARLDTGAPISEIMGHKLASGDSPRQNFEDFLRLSFSETDYMSAFSLEEADRDSTIVRYIRAAARRGLDRYNRTTDYVREPIKAEQPSTNLSNGA